MDYVGNEESELAKVPDNMRFLKEMIENKLAELKEVPLCGTDYNYEYDVDCCNEREFDVFLNSLPVPIAARLVDRLLEKETVGFRIVNLLIKCQELYRKFEGIQVAKVIATKAYDLTKWMYDRLSTNLYCNFMYVKVCTVLFCLYKTDEDFENAERMILEIKEIALKSKNQELKNHAKLLCSSWKEIHEPAIFTFPVIDMLGCTEDLLPPKTHISSFKKSFSVSHNFSSKSIETLKHKLMTNDVGDDLKKSKKVLQQAIANESSKYEKLKLENAIGSIFAVEGRNNDAFKRHLQLLMAAVDHGDLLTFAKTLPYLANASELLSSSKNSLEFALACSATHHDLTKLLGLRRANRMAKLHMSHFFISLGLLKEASRVLMDALYESKKVKDNFFIGICYENFGLISQDLKNYNKAVSFHKRALELMKQYGDQAHISKGNLYFAHDLCLIQDFEKAVYHTKESILGAETLRLKMGSDDASKVSSFDNRQISAFNFLIYQLLVQGKSGQALSVSELAHGRALSDMLAYKFKSSLELSNKTWLSEEDIISKSRLDNMFLEEEIPSFYISTANRFHTTILVYSLIMLADHPWLCIWVIKPIEFLKSGESSIHCIKVPGDKIFPSNKTERDRLFAKISKYTTQISHGKTSKEKTTAECNQGPNEAKCSPEDKATARGQMERITLSNSIENESYEALRLFYDVCIGPVAEFLPNPDDHNVTRITVIPSSWLFKVPFCALISPSKRYLIQDYIISYTPSLRSFLLLRHRLEERERNLKNRKLKVVAIGNPKTASCWELEELPGAENELKCVQNIFGIESCHVIDKEAATKEEIMKCMKEVDVLHVVSHGDTEEPVDCSDEDPLNFFFPDTYLMKGCLFLSPDGNKCNGLLCSRDLQDLFCDISLVTLSCCKTGSGQVTNDSILGLYRAFLVAGACGVVSSPWLVSDAITPYFMDNFYRCFLVDRDVPKALRSAMLNLIEANVSWKNWAAFSYTGALSLV